MHENNEVIVDTGPLSHQFLLVLIMGNPFHTKTNIVLNPKVRSIIEIFWSQIFRPTPLRVFHVISQNKKNGVEVVWGPTHRSCFVLF